MKNQAWIRPFVALVVLLTGLIPVLIYMWVFNQAPVLDVDTALTMLNDPAQNAVLVDVRSTDEFSEMYIVGSTNWPASEIATLNSQAEMPLDFRGRKLLLICNSGFQSAQSAEKLKSLGADDVYSIKGGMQKWIGAGNSSFQFTEIVYSSTGTPLRKPMSIFEQTAAVVSGFGFKPLHMLLSAVLGFVLLRQKAFDLRILGWGVVIFLAAEIFCAINYLFYDHDSYLAEYLHSYGMTLSFGVVFFAIMQIMDERLLKVSAQDKHCILLPLCRGCVKYGQGSCKMRSLFQLGTGAIVVLAFIPLLAIPTTTSYVTEIFGTSYNYCRLLLNQYFEGRYLPLTILFLCCGALLVMKLDRGNTVPLLARIFLAGAAGALGFSMFRLALGSMYSDNLIWADFWEEITELMFIGLAAVVVWIYRNGLLDTPIGKEMFGGKST